MKTAKRNARTATIFNNVMYAVTSIYERKLGSVYNKKEDFIFHFLDPDGKVIYNTFGPNKDLINKGRRVSLVDSDNYIKVINPETRQFFIDIHKFDINQFDNDTFISYLIERIDSLSESYFIRDLCKDYIRRAHQKKNYRALILFETIFGYQFLTRKQIDRIRYITFSDGEIYDVMNGYMIPGSITCLLRQKYFVEAAAISSETEYDCEKILSNIVFKKIKNMLLSFGRGVSQEEIYDICGSIMLALNPSLKYLIPDYHYPIFKERIEKLFKDRSSFIPKNEFQLKHTIFTDGKKNYCAYQERQESNT